MKWLEKLLNFYVNASIHVALAVVSFLYLSAVFLKLELKLDLVLAVFFGTIPAYNSIKYGGYIQKQRLSFRNTIRPIVWLSITSFLIALYFSLSLGLNSWIVILLSGILAFLYAQPLFPYHKNLRDLGWLKVLIVALVWSAITVLLPAMEINGRFSWDSWIEFYQRFLLILILMIPFEIRDLASDPKSLHTLPQILGIKNTKWVGGAMAALFFILTYFKDEFTFSELYLKSLIALTLLGLLVFLPKNQPKYFASFWVEGLPVFWVACYWMGLIIF